MKVRLEEPAGFLARFMARVLERKPAGIVTEGSVSVTAGGATAVMRFTGDGVTVSTGGDAETHVSGSLAALSKASRRGLPVGAWWRGEIRVRGRFFLALRFLKLFQS